MILFTQKSKDVAKLIKSKSPATKLPLFVEGSEEIFHATIKMNQEVAIDAVEIHTGDYAKCILDGNDHSPYIDNFLNLKDLYQKSSIGFHAGHGLTADSLRPLCEANVFEEYNIGHWISLNQSLKAYLLW